MKKSLLFLAVCSAGACACAADVSDDPEPRPVTQTIRLLEDGNIGRHWYTWLRSQRARDVDPDRVFTAEGSTLKVSGTDMGCVTTRDAYRDYKLTLEFRYVDNDVQLNMCEARGCGNPHCRVVAERRDTFGLEKQDWLDHRGQAFLPVHDTPPERRVKHAQGLRNGQYTNAFGEEQSLEWQYNWVAQMGWVWSISFPLIAIRDMADDDDETSSSAS